MTRYRTWWTARLACGLALLLLTPVSLAVVWATKLAQRAQDHADIELLRAAAYLRINKQTNRTQR